MGIGEAISVLGLFFALMAILAIMVEAIVGALKLPNWSPIKGKPSPEDVLKEVRSWVPINSWNELVAQKKALEKAAKEIGGIELPKPFDLNASTIAEYVGLLMTKHVKDEKNRRFIIKLVAIVIGSILAFVLEINTLEVLRNLQGAEAFGEFPDWVGFVVSGIAASAGSHFWHDWSAQLRQLKSAKEAIGKLT